MFQIALRMLLHRPMRAVATVIGIAAAFFLVAAQVGMLVGWCNTTSAIILHTDADIWIMARETPALDYGAAIPKHRLYQARSVSGVRRAHALFLSWSVWQRPDGKRASVEIIGLDHEGIGGPWEMRSGRPDDVFLPDRVMVDELYLERLGVSSLGQEFEMMGNRAIVSGISRGVRTFTATPYVFASLATAVKYDTRYSKDDIMYVVVKCEPGTDVRSVRDAIVREVPHVEALTAWEFAARTVQYWMLRTGAGMTVVVTAALGLVVGALITSQNLSAITTEYIPNYATLVALGFDRVKLCGVILAQSTLLCAGGVAIGAQLFFLASRVSSTTPLPLETTPALFGCLVSLSFLNCALASLASIRSLFRVDPISVFRV